jgi:hypothetical protein
MLSSTIISAKSSKSVFIKIGHKIPKILVMLSVLADKGKLKPFAILTEKLMVKWLRVVWDKRSGDLLKKE